MSLDKRILRHLPGQIKRRLYERECVGKLGSSDTMANLEELLSALDLISKRPCHTVRRVGIVPHPVKVDLSIIVPVYNAESYLCQCISSCLNQVTGFSFEVIAVDDGSTDASPSMLDAFASDTRLKVIHQDNLGHSGARNSGLDVAAGKYICFVDSDDFIPNDAVQRLLSCAVDLDADIVGGGFWFCNSKGRRRRFKGMCNAAYISPVLGLSGFPWGSVYRRSLWDDVRFPEGFWFEDTCVPYLIFSRAKKTASISGSVYNYRLNPKGITSTSRSSKRSLDSIWVVLEMFDEMQRLGISMTPLLYEQTLRQFGPLLRARLQLLDNRELQLAFQCCSAIVQSIPERFGVFKTGEYWLNELETSLVTSDFEKWLSVCQWM